MGVRAGLAFIMLTTLIGASGCDEKLSDLVGSTPNLAPTFSSIHAEILQSTDLAGRTMPRSGAPYLPGQITVIHGRIETALPTTEGICST
jgi:hypothetical protein